MINYVIAGNAKGEWFVIDIRGGFDCRVLCETDSRGKAAVIAHMFNTHGNDRGAPPSFTSNGRDKSKSNSGPVPDPETPPAQAETD